MKRKRDQSVELESDPDYVPVPAVERVPSPDIEACITCGGALTWDPAYVGTTCGGLDLVGGLVCACGAAYLSSARSKPAEKWKLAQSGTSLDAGGIRVRAERSGDVAALMARIVCLPDLEREVASLRAQLAQKIEAARGLSAEQIRATLNLIEDAINTADPDPVLCATYASLSVTIDRMVGRLRGGG